MPLVLATLAIAASFAPAWRASRTDPNTALRGPSTTWRGRLALRDLLVIVQVALCFVLVSGSFLSLRGLQQALLLTIFAHNPDTAAFSVGQQIATAVLSSALGFAALVLIFRFTSFREVIARAREHRQRKSISTA